MYYAKYAAFIIFIFDLYVILPYGDAVMPGGRENYISSKKVSERIYIVKILREL